MVEFFILSVAIIIFLSICYFLRIKEIELPNSDVFESFVIFSILFIGCLIWPISLPIAIVSYIGLRIVGKFDD